MARLIRRFAGFLLVVFAVVMLMNSYRQQLEEDGRKYLEDSIEVAVNSCYGTEGKYPASLDYLLENYGVVYDSDRYIVFYETFGSNVRPVVKVIKRD